MVVEAGRTPAGPVRLVGSPIDMSAAPLEIRLAPPTLGAHNAEVLRPIADERKVGVA
jgi:formyl-CoA transferase